MAASLLLTGASGVLGKALAQGLAADPEFAGERYCLPCRHGSRAQGLRACLPERLDLQTPLLDLEDPFQVQAFCEQTLPSLGLLRAVVLAAGISADASVARMEERDWDRVVQVNALSAAALLEALLKNSSWAEGASVLLVGSVVGLRGNHGQSAYSASKGLLMGLLGQHQRAFARQGARINLILPPLADSPLLAGLKPEARERLFSQRLLADPDPAASFASSARFLLSARSAYIHAAAWHADSRISGLPWE